MKVAFVLLSTAASFFLSAVNALDAKKIKAELMKGQIIPDAFDDIEPTADMTIAYGEDIVLQNGDALQSKITMTAPRVTFTPKNDTEYTLAMINLDSNASQIIHWMTFNIHDKDLASGDQLATYRGPIIPAGSSNHRIVYALFEQEGKAAFIPALEDRKFFNVKIFASENNLKLVNAAYFYAQPRQYAEPSRQNIKQKGLLGNLFDNIGDLVDDLGNIVGINIGDDDDGDDYYGDDDDEDNNDGGLHISIGLNDGVHIGVGHGHDGKLSSVVHSSGQPSSVARSSGGPSSSPKHSSVARSSDEPSASPEPSKSVGSSSNNAQSHKTIISSVRHIHYSYSSHHSSHSVFYPTPN